MDEDGKSAARRKRGNARPEETTKDGFRLSAAAPDLLQYVYQIIAPRHKDMGKGKWSAVRVDVLSELMLDLPIERLRKQATRLRDWLSKTPLPTNPGALRDSLLVKYPPKTTNLVEIAAAALVRTLSVYQRIVCAQAMHAVEPTAETAAAVRAACSLDVKTVAPVPVQFDESDGDDVGDDDSEAASVMSDGDSAASVASEVTSDVEKENSRVRTPIRRVKESSPGALMLAMRQHTDNSFTAEANGALLRRAEKAESKKAAERKRIAAEKKRAEKVEKEKERAKAVEDAKRKKTANANVSSNTYAAAASAAASASGNARPQPKRKAPDSNNLTDAERTVADSAAAAALATYRQSLESQAAAAAASKANSAPRQPPPVAALLSASSPSSSSAAAAAL